VIQPKINLLPYLIISSIVFIMFIFVGTRLPSDVTSELMSQIEESLSPLASMGPLSLITVIFINNTLKCLVIIISGILLGLPSLAFICINAVTVGMLTAYLGTSTSLMVMIAALAPHGIIEIPLLVVSTAMGLAIGSETLKFLTRQKSTIKSHYIYSLKIYLKWMLALFLLAALIEVLLTPIIISLAGGVDSVIIP
jgi:stage II sporulation protein M